MYLYLIIIFIILYFYLANFTEGFESNGTSGTPRCPNLLIQKGTQYYLYNTKLKQVPGVNPIIFNDLNEYTQFLTWQNSQGIRCPVLYLQHGYNAQGESEYKIRPSTTELQGGLPSTSNPTLTSSNSTLTSSNPTSDTLNSTSNVLNSIYKSLIIPQSIFMPNKEYPNEYYLWNSGHKNSSKNIADQSIINKYADPMSKWWKGAKYTEKEIDKGVYSGNEVNIYVP